MHTHNISFIDSKILNIQEHGLPKKRKKKYKLLNFKNIFSFIGNYYKC